MSGRLPPEFIEKVREQVNILDVVGEHVVLKKSGSNYMGLCPFHSERSPSFTVSEVKKVYHCHGCKRGGDLFKFVCEMHGVSFPEAVEELAERAHLALPTEYRSGAGNAGLDAEREKQRKKQQTASRLNLFAAQYFKQELTKNGAAKNYLSHRGISEEVIKEFWVGYAPNEWEALTNYLTKAKAPLPLAVELGLIRPSNKAEGGYFDLFRNRVQFPILDVRGKVVGFGGRALNDEPPKYLNSSESFVFKKDRQLFGMFQAQKHIRALDEVILVEGYFDVMALHAAGFKNAVGICGTALSVEHLRLLSKFTQRVTLLLDGDAAGTRAAERAMELGLEQGQILYEASLPEGLDPDEMLFDQKTGAPLEKGVENLRQILMTAVPILDRRIDQLAMESKKGPEALTQVAKRLGHWLSLYSDPVGREIRIKDVEKKTGLSRAVLRSAMTGQAAGTATKPSTSSKPSTSAAAVRPPRPQPGKPVRLSNTDKMLLLGFIQGGAALEILSKARDKLPPNSPLAELFEYQGLRKWFEDHLLALQPAEIGPYILAHLDDLDPQVSSVVTASQVAEGKLFESADFEIAVERAMRRIRARFSQQIKEAMMAAEARNDGELRAKLAKEYLDLQKEMKEVTRSYDEA